MDGVLRLFAGVHEHFVEKDKCGKSILARHLKQLFQREITRRGVALFIFSIGAQGPQAISAGDLKGDNAPGLFRRLTQIYPSRSC